MMWLMIKMWLWCCIRCIGLYMFGIVMWYDVYIFVFMLYVEILFWYCVVYMSVFFFMIVWLGNWLLYGKLWCDGILLDFVYVMYVEL